jgi:hypothetical protein
MIPTLSLKKDNKKIKEKSNIVAVVNGYNL